jgi:hypothetical protein
MKRKQSNTHQQANTQTPIQAFTESKKEKTMKINRINLILTALAVSAFLSQAFARSFLANW